MLESNKNALDTVASMGKTVICTLFEGDYHFGLAALANSAYAWGYRGVIYAGYRGALPPWAHGATVFQAAEDLQIRFLKIETEVHFTFCKGALLERIFDHEVPDASAVIYVDPDIIFNCRWEVITDWVEDRVALCQDVNWNCPRSHPIRRDWDRYLNPHGIYPQHATDFYFNAGFIGVARSQRSFVKTLQTVVDLVIPLSGNGQGLEHRDQSYCFHKGDQDALNVAADIHPEKISSMGPEAMDFVPGGHTMSHAVGVLKPWQNPFLKTALSGRAPSKADKLFFEHVSAPIQVLPAEELASKRLQLRVAAAIGRVIRRS